MYRPCQEDMLQSKLVKYIQINASGRSQNYLLHKPVQRFFLEINRNL